MPNDYNENKYRSSLSERSNAAIEGLKYFLSSNDYTGYAAMQETRKETGINQDKALASARHQEQQRNQQAIEALNAKINTIANNMRVNQAKYKSEIELNKYKMHVDDVINQMKLSNGTMLLKNFQMQQQINESIAKARYFEGLEQDRQNAFSAFYSYYISKGLSDVEAKTYSYNLLNLMDKPQQQPIGFSIDPNLSGNTGQGNIGSHSLPSIYDSIY